jgi:hypothetical protein
MINSLNLQNSIETDICIDIKLADKEISRTDILHLGNIVYGKAMALSRKVNSELLEPISRWLDNPDWMCRFEIIEDQVPNWAAYKRKTREWTTQQKRLAAERLKLYWTEIKRKKNFSRKLFEIKPSKAKSHICANTSLRKYAIFNDGFLSPIVAPFCPKAHHKVEIQREFQQALSLSVSDLFPWKLLILSELDQSKCFTALTVYYPDNRKKDIVSKLMHLLQMEADGMLKLTQEEHLGEITIEPLEKDPENIIEIKDRHGLDYRFNWNDLSGNQKDKILCDIRANKIICKKAVTE